MRDYKDRPRELGQERALVVSLRDDEGMTGRTMEGILKQCWKESEPRMLLHELQKQGRLSISYYPPGFITPEEFFHRMMLSIHRLKRDGGHVTVLFNSLDQLSSRFPLCAEQQIFVPGIVQMLSAEGATSYFVAARERPAGMELGKVMESEHHSGNNYGLDAMAELILLLDRRKYSRTEYFNYIKDAFPSPLSEPDYFGKTQEYPNEITSVQLSVERFAGGQPAGAAGILELVKPDGLLREICGTDGLIVVR
jgi:hypothetical protein